MSDREAPLTANSSVGTWLEHPVGAQLLRELLADSGLEPDVLAPVRNLPLHQLATMSGGQLDEDTVHDLVLRANGGVVPEVDEVEAGFAEKITPGRFDGKTVVITGAGGGIGRASASRVAREGGRVVAVDVAPDGLERLAADLPDSDVVTAVADITDEQGVQRVTEVAGSRIDALANIAGVADGMQMLHETTDAVWNRVMGVNVEGIFRLSRAVIPVMLRAGQGSIVNITSEAGLRGSAAGVAYTTSKHAVVGLTRNSAFMYGQQGLRVNAVAPGGVATGIAQELEPSLGRQRLDPGFALMPPIATPQQLAASITFLLSDDATNINGAILPSDGGWSAQ